MTTRANQLIMGTKKTTKKITKNMEIVFFGGLVMGAILLTGAISNSYLSAQQKADQPVDVNCINFGQTHFVYIKDNRFYPKEIVAKPCDILTIINHDKYRLLAFGQHTNHIEYNGTDEISLKKDGSFTVELNKTGQYVVHDHLQESVVLTFSVQP